MSRFTLATLAPARSTVLSWLSALLLVSSGLTAYADHPLPPESGATVVWLGGTFVERMQLYGLTEYAMQTRWPKRDWRFRNLGWSGDLVTGLSRAVFGTPDEGYQRLLRDLKQAKPTTVVVCYGANEAHGDQLNESEFGRALERLVNDIQAMPAAVILMTPLPYEAMGPPLPDPEEYNQRLDAYCQVIRQLAERHTLPLIDLNRSDPRGLTYNGVHLAERGYAEIAQRIAQSFTSDLGAAWSVALNARTRSYAATGTALQSLTIADDSVGCEVLDDFLPPPPLAQQRPSPLGQGQLQVSGLAAGTYELRINEKPIQRWTHQELATGVSFPRQAVVLQAAKLRQQIVKKNELYFHRHRPQNETYLFLFRKHEQGNNAGEVPAFEDLVEEVDQRIRELKQPQSQRLRLVRINPNSR